MHWVWKRVVKQENDNQEHEDMQKRREPTIYNPMQTGGDNSWLIVALFVTVVALVVISGMWTA